MHAVNVRSYANLNSLDTSVAEQTPDRRHCRICSSACDYTMLYETVKWSWVATSLAWLSTAVSVAYV